MKTSLLYKIFGIGILVVIFVVCFLWRVEHSLLPQKEVHDSNPPQSGLSEAEFESGEPVKKLQAAQEKELHEYRGDLAHDHQVQVPIERAIEVYLKENSGGSPK